MGDILKHESKIFGAAEFCSAWALWAGKGHDPASKLQAFTVTVDGAQRVNVGLVDYATLESVVFPSRSHETYAAAFAAIGKALENV